MTSKVKTKLGIDWNYFKFIKAYSLCKTETNYPVQWLMIEPTNRCNLSCVMCPQAGKLSRKKGFMDFSLFKRIIDEASEFVKTAQLFHSGESFLHPRIFDMIHYTASHSMYSLINTNGTLIDKKKAKAILDSGLNSISFSFDSFHKATYESIRKGASFNKTLRNIEYFLNLKAQHRQKYPLSIIEIIDMKATRPYLKSFIKQAKVMGFDEVRIWKFHNWTNNDIISERHSPFSKKTNAYYPCEYPFFQMSIYWDGTVVPCCLDYNGSYPLGTLSKTTTLKSIWNNDRSQHLRNSMRTRTTSKTKLCKNCSFLIEPRSSKSIPGKLFSHYAGFIGYVRKNSKDLVSKKITNSK